MKVDIILATYKRYDLLPHTLESVQNQTFKDWRCWISEDGSDPKTKECIQPFLKDERFRHITGEHVGFPAGPRNRAILLGNAQYIAILDDDDLWAEEKLEKQIHFLESHPTCVMLGTNGYRWLGKNKSTTNLPLYHEKINYGKIDLNFLLKDNCFIASSVMLRRSALEKCGLFNEKLNPPIGEDHELWYRIASAGDLWFMEDPLVFYRDLPPTYYNPLKGQALNAWRINLLQAALEGSNVPSPFRSPENADLKKLFEEKIEYFRTGPHLLGEIGYKIKKFFGLLPKK
ncbi:MAG: glycosyltransferase family 2 protein [Bacillota bacterium]